MAGLGSTASANAFFGLPVVSISRAEADYQHVGQVFDDKDVARLTDIDGFIRGVPIPSSCRKHAEWIYG